MRTIYQAGGMGWGKAKSMLFETINESLVIPRREFQRLMDDTNYLDQVLAKGAEKARVISEPFMREIHQITGI